MGNSNCRCNKTRKVGGSRVKSKKGGMGCKSRSHNIKRRNSKRKGKKGGCTTCGCEAPQTGGYKYNRGASIASKVRFNKRVSKKVKKNKRKTINKKKHAKKGKKKSRSTRK